MTRTDRRGPTRAPRTDARCWPFACGDYHAAEAHLDGSEPCACRCHPPTAPADALTQDECDAIGADGRDGRGWITEANLSPAERAALAAYRAHAAPM